MYRAADKYQIDGLLGAQMLRRISCASRQIGFASVQLRLESCGAFIEKHVDPSNVMQAMPQPA